MINEVLRNLTWDPDGASYHYKDIRYFLSRPETLIEVYRQIEERFGDAAREIFYQAGFKGVSLSMQAYVRAGMLPPGEELLAFMAEMAGNVGWGKVSSFSLDNERRRMVLEFQSSVFAHGQSDQKHPVCDAIRGAFAAVGEALWDSAVSSEETRCMAMGHDRCRFEFAASE